MFEYNFVQGWVVPVWYTIFSSGVTEIKNTSHSDCMARSRSGTSTTAGMPGLANYLVGGLTEAQIKNVWNCNLHIDIVLALRHHSAPA